MAFLIYSFFFLCVFLLGIIFFFPLMGAADLIQCAFFSIYIYIFFFLLMTSEIERKKILGDKKKNL